MHTSIQSSLDKNIVFYFVFFLIHRLWRKKFILKLCWNFFFFHLTSRKFPFSEPVVPKGLKIVIHLLICINISLGKIKHFVITFVFSMVSLVVWMRMAPYAHIFAGFQLTNRFWSLKELFHLEWIWGFKKILTIPSYCSFCLMPVDQIKILENSEAPILPAAACPSLPVVILDSSHSWTISSKTGFLL